MNSTYAWSYSISSLISCSYKEEKAIIIQWNIIQWKKSVNTLTTVIKINFTNEGQIDNHVPPHVIP